MAICDRSVLDTFVYYHAVNPSNCITEAAMKQASQWLSTYDVLICLEPQENTALQDDGIRSTDRSYQALIEKGFKETIRAHADHVADRILYASSRDVFEERRRGELIARVENGIMQLFAESCC